MSDVYHADPAINAMLSVLNEEDRSLFLRATYFVLESHEDCSLETLDGAPEYALHIGLPDRPSRRYAVEFVDLEDGLEALADLRRVFPNNSLWISCLEILAPIEDENVWIGAVKARASGDPNSTICEWAQLAKAICKAQSRGGLVVVSEIFNSTIQAIAERI
jgi:hypothetical protein